MKARPHQLLRDAGAGTYAIPGFAVETPAAVRGVLRAADAMNVPVVLHLPPQGEVWHEAAQEAQHSIAPVVLHVDFPQTGDDIVRAFEAGIESFTILPAQDSFAQAIRGRAGWVGAFIGRPGSQMGPMGRVDAIHAELPVITGAFTGRHYILFDALEGLLKGAATVGVHGAEHVAPSHVRILAAMPLSTVMFRTDVPGEGRAPTEETVFAFAVDKIRPLAP